MVFLQPGERPASPVFLSDRAKISAFRNSVREKSPDVVAEVSNSIAVARLYDASRIGETAFFYTTRSATMQCHDCASRLNNLNVCSLYD